MVTLTISLSKEQKAFIDAQVKARGLESASVYLSQLVLIEQLKPDRSRIEALLHLPELKPTPAPCGIGKCLEIAPRTAGVTGARPCSRRRHPSGSR